jgi:[ribosomal protein S18]-alanine N-acetyltransferase
LPYYVRCMKMEDIKRATDIDREAFPTMIMPTNFESEFRNSLAHYVVACDEEKAGDDNIIAIAGIWVLVSEAHIVNIAVQPGYRCRGIGELLIISLIQLALDNNCNMMTLEVRVSNGIAQNLYLKYGFTIKGIRRRYYTDNREDAIIMTADNIHIAPFKELYDRLKKEHYIKYGCSRIRLSKC